MDVARPIVAPIVISSSLKEQTYEALRQAITSMNIYEQAEAPKLDERYLAESLGVSRTPVREALARLEQEGLVQTIPRRGVFVVRKTKAEIIEIVTAWAALESMAARLATANATDEEIANLRTMFAEEDGDSVRAHLDEYSDKNIAFHQAILALGKCDLIEQMADNLFIHMRSIRSRTIGDGDRAVRSVIDHMNIIEALERRDPGLAETLVREHSMRLAEHIRKHVDDLD
ncbi:MAG: GntR family transcriptional regulator [Rhodospirillaceae bacterium]|nr:GntR family transcriptional regulator [Rhodospirillaceae bacterium]|tara:strand:+ start:83 stop:772 length:690 start_codon:yes stop_codon:yes gene_type:complete